MSRTPHEKSMRRPPAPSGLCPRSQAGFTLAEIMAALVIFVVSVGGIVAMESRAMEAQAAVRHVKGAERIAQRLMSEAMATGFDDLVSTDALGNVSPLPHFDDLGLVDFRPVPADLSDDEITALPQREFYKIHRRVTQVMFQDSERAGINPAMADAIAVEVFVLWLEPAVALALPPEDTSIEDLLPENMLSDSPDYQSWVQGVHLRMVRLNDG